MKLGEKLTHFSISHLVMILISCFSMSRKLSYTFFFLQPLVLSPYWTTHFACSHFLFHWARGSDGERISGNFHFLFNCPTLICVFLGSTSVWWPWLIASKANSSICKGPICSSQLKGISSAIFFSMPSFHFFSPLLVSYLMYKYDPLNFFVYFSIEIYFIYMGVLSVCMSVYGMCA